MKIKKEGFTLVEVLIALSVMIFLSVIAMNNFFHLTSKVDKVKFKNANLSFKHALEGMLSNPSYYSDDLGFLDTSNVDMNDRSATNNVRYDDKYKFRHLLLHELGVGMNQGAKKCYMITNSDTPELHELCYRAENGIIWAIPDTDFKSVGVVKRKNSSGGTSRYAPVTIYTNAAKIDTEDGFYHDAIIIGVRADGSLTLINTLDCEDKQYKGYAQCDIADMFASLNTK